MRIVRNIGIALFLMSFLAPWSGKSGDGPKIGGGFVAFIYAPIIAIHFLKMHRVLLCVGLLISWAASFTIFFRLPLIATWVAIALPWIAYICWFSVAARFIQFYPWAFGIGMIHLSKLIKTNCKK
jgi:hypothetical protein